jgi:hypothetical protein
MVEVNHHQEKREGPINKKNMATTFRDPKDIYIMDLKKGNNTVNRINCERFSNKNGVECLVEV